MRKVFSLVFVRRPGEVLLGYKKRGLGAGKWNGFGGKLEPPESIVECAVRELKEECGLTTEAGDLSRIGLLRFRFENEDPWFEVHVFQTLAFAGQLMETEEMRPRWFKLKDIPYKNMWPDDEHWFPHMLRGDLFQGEFLYRGQDLILNHTIASVEKLPIVHPPVN